jgi:hypothetical protein
MDEIKLKNVSNPLELLETLKALKATVDDNAAAAEKIKQVHETLGGTQYIKVFTNLDGCSLLNGNSNLAGGYLYC